MKKVFLFLTMLLFAFVGTMRADELTVCDGTGYNSYIPVYGTYADTQGCQSEFVIPADQLGSMIAGEISKLTFYLNSSPTVAWTATFQVYMTEIEGTTLSTFVGPSASTVVYEGTLDPTGSTMEVTFDNNYTYNGGNLLIGTQVVVAGNWKAASFLGVTATGASINRSSSSGSATQRNFLPKTTFEYEAGVLPTGITVTPNPIDLGVRASGAWMAPFVVELNNVGTPTTVSTMVADNNFFVVNAETPFNMAYGATKEVGISTATAEEGTQSGNLYIIYSTRESVVVPITATAYTPGEGDVYELAQNVTVPFTGTAPTGIYKNYDIPGAGDAPEAMYKVTFNNDVMLGADIDGENDAFAVYAEDFNGEGGPMVDNVYVYGGPEVGPAPVDRWFSYSYTGTNTFYGSSAGGGMVFGYKIPVSTLQAYGLGLGSIIEVEAAAREGSYYDLVILQGGDTPDLNNMVYYQEFTDYEPMYFFHIDLDEPQFLGDEENIWVMLYSDSPYAAYCGKYPVDTNNGKIWYTSNFSTWYSSTTYTPVIYTHFMTLDGREVVVNLADMSIRKSDGATGEMAAVDGTVMGTSKAQMAANNMRGNRDMQTVLSEGFEGGTMPTGWETEGSYSWSITSGTGHSSYTGAATGNYNAGCYISSYSGNSYLITPEMDLSNATSATLSFNFWNTTWGADINELNVFYRVDGGAWNLLENYDAVVSPWAPKTITLTGLAANYQIGFQCVAHYSYGMGIDDVLVTADINVGPTPPTPPAHVYKYNNYLPAGTYYLAAASTTEGFGIDLGFGEAPLPVQAIVVSPTDGASNVENPCVAEWIIGNYTNEMQVLCGTQYPPQTILIDWTSNLVAGMFLPDLEPNQSYFLQVNERNAAGTTMGEIIAFTTPIDAVEGLEVEDDELYPGEAAVFTWVANRALKGYNIYCNGIKVNDTPITSNTTTVEDIDYNMDGYEFTVTAVYDAGESLPSEPVTVYMTGNGTVTGVVYDTDETHPVALATVEFIGLDEYDEPQVFDVTTDENGEFTGDILAGEYLAFVATEGYDATEGYAVTVNYNETTDQIVIITHEFYYPLGQITATEQIDDDNVLVEWSWDPAEMIVDFETGDFSQAEFTLPASYPWAITTTNPYEGTYCMKSTCEGIASGTSSIQATVEVPFAEAKMGFWVRVSSEANYDKFHFYIDGVEQGAAISGQMPYAYKEYSVTEGTHTYKWEYAKDSSVNSNDDCVYVDYITMYRKDEPVPPTPGATVYNFDDNTMMGWTSIDADGDGNGWVSSANPGIYHNSGVNLSGTGHNSSEAYVISGSYANQTGQALTPDNYLVAPAQISAVNGAQIQFWACAQDASYAAEHFGVAVSTTTATAGAFTTIQEWTMTAKDRADAVDADRTVRGTRQGSWYQYTVDLSSYAGQDIWVAIRHFNCTDMFILNVDDITLADGSAKGTRGDRSFVSYNLYRRNNIDEASVADPELIAEGIAGDVYEYIDNEWAELPFGEWQWGIAATYDGYAPVDRTVAPSIDRNADDNNANTESTTVNVNGNRDTWDLVYSFEGTSGYQYGVATDGNYIYTSSWSSSSSSMFYKYDMQGNFVEEFNITGCGQLRGMTYDGQYFYGVANSSTVYCVDLANHALISSFTTTYGAMRCITYDPVRDGFWVVGNWSGNLTLISRTGAIVQAAGAPTSASDVAYYKDSDNVEHIYYLKNETGNGEVHEYNITTNTMGTTALFNCASTSAWTGSSGGCFVAEYNDKVCFFADAQQSPQLICIYELEAATPGPGPGPTPPTPGPTGTGMSEILWSNVLDKDMITELTLNVALNNAQNPAGAEVVLVNAFNEYGSTVEESGVVELVVRKGVYNLSIELEGYETYEEIIDIDEDEMTFTCVLEEIIAPVEDFEVSPTGWAHWTGGTVGPTPGPGPTPGEGTEFTEGFESGIPATWNTIDADGDGYNWERSSVLMAGYSITPHSGDDMVSSQSYDSSAGALTPDNYLVTPQVTLVNGSTFSFWAAAQDASYAAEHFGVGVSDNGTTFTMVQEWTLTAKEGPKGMRGMNAMGSYYQYSVDLSQYAGLKYIAIRHFNCTDEFYIDVDDVELSIADKGNRAALSYKVKLDGEYVGESVYPFFQLPVEGIEEGSVHTVNVAPLYATGMGEWMDATWTYTPCSEYAGLTQYGAEVNDNDVTLTWTYGDQPVPPTPPTPGTGEWYYYDNGVNDNNIGASGPFYWAVMFPGGSYNGDYVTKVATYDSGTLSYAFTGTATIYQGGTTTPGTAVGTVNVATTGSAAGFVEYEFAEPVTIDDSQNLWVVFYNATSTSYCAAAYTESGAGNANARWVSLDGSSWMDLATAGISGYGWMLRVYVAEGAKGEVHEISVPTQACNNAGQLSQAPVTRDGRTVIYEPHFVTDPGAMANGADASWTKGTQSTWGPNCNNGGGYKMADDFTLTAATTISEIEVYGYQTGSSSTSTFTGLYAQIYNAAPNAGGTVVWGDETTNIMTSTAFTNCYRGSDGTTTATTRPIMSVTASNLNIQLEAGTYYLVWSLAGSASSGPWAAPEAIPGEGNTGNGLQYTSSGWTSLTDSGAGTTYGAAFKLVGEGSGPVPPTPGEVLGVMIWRDGEPLSLTPIAGNTYTDNDVEAGEHVYDIRVVYADYAMSCTQSEEVTIDGPVTCDPVINLDGYYMNYQGQEGIVIDWEDPEGAITIKLYEGTEYLGEVAAGTHPLFLSFEGQVPACTITIGAVAVYADCESEMVSVDIYYDAVEENEVVNAIYPNPTSADLHINATAMKHVSVYNAMGQMVLDQEVSGDEVILNMGQFEAGVYMVKVTTETGSSVKRINVVK